MCVMQEFDGVIVLTYGDPFMAVRQEMVTEGHWKLLVFQFMSIENTGGGGLRDFFCDCVRPTAQAALRHTRLLAHSAVYCAVFKSQNM